MKKKKAAKLKELILNEINYREEFTKLSNQLTVLIDTIREHNKECCEFWDENLSTTNNIIVQMDNDIAFKVEMPVNGECSFKINISHGIRYIEYNLINLKEK